MAGLGGLLSGVFDGLSCIVTAVGVLLTGGEIDPGVNGCLGIIGAGVIGLFDPITGFFNSLPFRRRALRGVPNQPPSAHMQQLEDEKNPGIFQDLFD